ncbi:MAG: hypothetical protein WAM82_33075 [Thermoanaerobaculia bacterium]
MFWIDLVGAVATLATLGFLCLGGYLAALRLLGSEAGRDPLTLAIATLLLSTAEAVGIGLLLGALGALRFDLALALQAVLSLVLLLGFRKAPPEGGVDGPARAIARRSWEILREHPVLSILSLHAVAAEALRGLIRPPLSWDSLMYHLLLAGTWLRDRNLFPVFGNVPVNYYGYVPANGSIWFWWWMAPSHSELYVNLASLPHWLLLGLATGAVARHLGARRHWPLAGFLVLLTPTVIRFAATEYVDIFLGATFVAAAYFALRWLREPAWSHALFIGMGLGLAAGAKVLGIPCALALAGLAVPLARGAWGRRAGQVVAALLMAALLGSFFYLRNVALGADPLAIACEETSSGPENANKPTIPRKNSVVDLWEPMIEEGQLLDSFLGITKPQSQELGVGPQAFVLLLVALAFPFGFLLGLGRERWRESLLIAGQVWIQLAFWLMVPFAKSHHIFANIRYLIPALGLVFAGGVALGERKGVRDRWMEGIALIFLVQGLLQLHAEMPRGVRLTLAVADVAAVALALSPGLRVFAVRRRRELALVGLALAILGAPFLARFRVEDRKRALGHEFTAHQTLARFSAAAWGWLEAHGGDGNVAAVSEPNNYFMYPAMGTHLERDVRYVNFNAANHPLAIQYPECQPRVDPSPQAWIANLKAQHIRWIHLGSYPGFDFPLERQWVEMDPLHFALRYKDDLNLIYELTPAGPDTAETGLSSQPSP